MINFKCYLQTKLYKCDFNVFIIFFSVYEICIINFGWVLKIILQSIIKILWAVKKNRNKLHREYKANNIMFYFTYISCIYIYIYIYIYEWLIYYFNGTMYQYKIF